jgi:hypothetical protein
VDRRRRTGRFELRLSLEGERTIEISLRRLHQSVLSMSLLRLRGGDEHWRVSDSPIPRLRLRLMTIRLSAIMLGRLRMSVDEALSQYTEFGNAVFGQPRWWHERSALFFPRAKYPVRKVRGAVLKVIHDKLLQKDSATTAWQATYDERFSSQEDQTRT